MDSQNGLPPLAVGPVDHDLPVEAPRPQQRRVEDFVAAAFRAAGLDWHEFVKTTARTSTHQQVINGLCGDPRKAEAELGWKRSWSFDAMVADLVQAELENRSELLRASPSVAN
jgi:GDP-D-mannose dehydratase